MAIKILIADDDSLIREGLKIILESREDFEVVCCVDNGIKAVNECSNKSIDVALVDIRMPDMNGVDATKIIVSNGDAKVLILTTFDEDELINDAMKNGASGYLLKNNSPEKIMAAIKTIHNGNSVIQDEILTKLLSNISVNKESFDVSIYTERELDIIKTISRGLSNKEIAKELFISEGTVKNYISGILNKSGLKHRTQIAIAYLKGH